eukprot:3482727-Lingulodinium_polyedra.AAC.1
MPALARSLVAGLQKVWPRRRFKTAWEVVQGWVAEHPPAAAPPAPREVALGLVSWLVAANQPDAAMAVFLCF